MIYFRWRRIKQLATDYEEATPVRLGVRSMNLDCPTLFFAASATREWNEFIVFGNRPVFAG